MMTMMDGRQLEDKVPYDDSSTTQQENSRRHSNFGIPEKMVTVLCDLTYEVSDTERHTIREEEQLLLLDQTNEDWWMVARLDEQHKSSEETPSSSSQTSNPLCSLPFFVPTSYVKLIQLPQQRDTSPNTEDCDDLRCDELNESKISDEAIGSSRDSIDEIGFEEESSQPSAQQPFCPTCDSHRRHQHNHHNHQHYQKVNQTRQQQTQNQMNHIYAEPFATLPFAPMPRKTVPALRRPEPEYANLCDLEKKEAKEEQEESEKLISENWKKLQQFSLKNNNNNGKKAQPRPPSLREENVLKRTLFDGWAEYEDANGRRFYCHPASGAKSWKPPRRLTAKVDFKDVPRAGSLGASPKEGHFHKVDIEGRKFSLDSSLQPSAREIESEYVELGNFNHHRSTEMLNNNSKTSVSTTTETKEQSTQTELANSAAVSEEATTLLPAGYRMAVNPLTKEVHLIGLDGVRWFCKRDENGQMYFYEEGQGMLGVSELPAFDDVVSMSHKDKMRSGKGVIKFMPIQSSSSSNHHHHDQGLQVNMDRSMKAHSVAMMVPSSRSPGGGGSNQSDMIIFNEQFKHTSPFQNVSIIIPSPPTSLNMKDIIYSGTLNRTRTVISGKVSKRKNWGTSYLVLTKYYLLFFKDQKSAFATSSPIKSEFVLGLLNASIDWCPNKSSRKNCFQVSTFQDQILLQDDKNDLSAKWFYNIQDAISKLPSPMQMNSMKSASIMDGLNDKSMPLKLKRSRSTKQYRPQEDFPPLAGNAKHATLSGYATIANTPMTDKKVKIRERLRQFLRKRPTMENLREKGIIKAENVFGRGLEELCTREGGPIPKFVIQCVEAIEFKDLKADGIYRACGNLSTVQKLRYEINQDVYGGLWREEDVHVLTGLLKMFFREMAEPLFPCDRFESLMKFIAIKNKDAKLDSFRRLVHDLPENNYQTLKFILRHLLRITEYSSENRMSVQNLAIVFGPTLIRPMSDLNNLVLDMMIQMQQSQVIEFLLLEYESIFDD